MAVSKRQTNDKIGKSFRLVTVERSEITKDTTTDMHTVCNSFVNCVCCDFKFDIAELTFYGRCSECELVHILDTAKSGDDN
jgi:hypothetical protein